ncbi:MAG: glycosyltransferase family 39 protein [Pseudomonadales bacterium]|nr:glycosyltransferase family 39 protein [Pseudomonadales bacterium]
MLDFIRQHSRLLNTLLIGGFFLLHGLLINSVGLGVDEAHYGLYALRLDWSYFDHPPMVGWLLALGQIAGQSDIALRLVPMLIMTINSVLLLQVCQRCFAEEQATGTLALLLFYLSVVTQLLGWGMVPDVALMTWHLLLILAIANLQQQFSWQGFVYLGVLIGLSGLTKYTAIVMPLALLSWLITQRQLLLWLAQPGLWLAVIIAAVMISPVIYWNATHDWVSLRYQFDHGAGGEWQLINVLKMLLAQWLSMAPVNVVLGVIVIYQITSRQLRLSPLPSLLLHLGLIHLLLVAWSAGNGELLPHWSAVGWLMLTPLTAHFCLLNAKQFSPLLRKVLQFMTLLSAVLLLILFSLLAFKPVNLIKGSEQALQDIMGWQQAAERAVALADTLQADYVWVENWTHSSRIAWYSYDSGYAVQVVDDKPNQFDLWHGEPQAASTAILVTPKKHKSRNAIKTIDLAHSICRRIDQLDFQYHGVTINHFNFYYCTADHIKLQMLQNS